jgi:hypothetical protein
VRIFSNCERALHAVRHRYSAAALGSAWPALRRRCVLQSKLTFGHDQRALLISRFTELFDVLIECAEIIGRRSDRRYPDDRQSHVTIISRRSTTEDINVTRTHDNGKAARYPA